jgi:hypothetical protein
MKGGWQRASGGPGGVAAPPQAEETGARLLDQGDVDYRRESSL